MVNFLLCIRLSTNKPFPTTGEFGHLGAILIFGGIETRKTYIQFYKLQRQRLTKKYSKEVIVRPFIVTRRTTFPQF